MHTHTQGHPQVLNLAPNPRTHHDGQTNHDGVVGREQQVEQACLSPVLLAEYPHIGHDEDLCAHRDSAQGRRCLRSCRVIGKVGGRALRVDLCDAVSNKGAQALHCLRQQGGGRTCMSNRGLQPPGHAVSSVMCSWEHDHRPMLRARYQASTSPAGLWQRREDPSNKSSCSIGSTSFLSSVVTEGAWPAPG